MAGSGPKAPCTSFHSTATISLLTRCTTTTSCCSPLGWLTWALRGHLARVLLLALTLFLQVRNPNVPDIPNKLMRRREARKFVGAQDAVLGCGGGKAGWCGLHLHGQAARVFTSRGDGSDRAGWIATSKVSTTCSASTSSRFNSCSSARPKPLLAIAEPHCNNRVFLDLQLISS